LKLPAATQNLVSACKATLSDVASVSGLRRKLTAYSLPEGSPRVTRSGSYLFRWSNGSQTW
jgi:hypothetical protein